MGSSIDLKIENEVNMIKDHIYEKLDKIVS
jgi:hypothetical protein